MKKLNLKSGIVFLCGVFILGVTGSIELERIALSSGMGYILWSLLVMAFALSFDNLLKALKIITILISRARKKRIISSKQKALKKNLSFV